MTSSTESPRPLAGKAVVVTGAARGIGKNIAAALGLAGASVTVCDIDRENGDQTVSELQAQGFIAEFLHVDLSQRGEAKAMVRRVAQRWGRLDGLINNARSGGRSERGRDEDEEQWELALSVTLRAAFFASQEAVHQMKKSGGGSIVNISSTVGLVAPYGVSGAYQVAKAGMLQMTRYFAVHGGPDNVRVNAVLPGFIVQDEHRDRFERSDNAAYRQTAELCHPLRRTGSSDDVANACVFLSASQSSFITGQCLVIDGGVSIQEHFSLLSATMTKDGTPDV